jgi:YVTN family beta-propeller protein
MDIYDHAIDPQTGQVFLVGAPAGAAAGSTPYTGPGRLVVLDGYSGRVLRRLSLSAPPTSVAVGAGGRRLLIGLIGRTSITGEPTGVGSVEVLDTHSLRVLRAIPVGIAPWQIAVDLRTDHAFVVNANIVPIGNDPSVYQPTHLTLPEDWWQAPMRRVKSLLPWLGTHVPAPSVNGSVTVLDLARV